eukprot:COSAG01_NODE_1883_length_8988_cov_67.877264_2_plen_112_part_00
MGRGIIVTTFAQREGAEHLRETVEGSDAAATLPFHAVDLPSIFQDTLHLPCNTDADQIISSQSVLGTIIGRMLLAARRHTCSQVIPIVNSPNRTASTMSPTTIDVPPGVRC